MRDRCGNRHLPYRRGTAIKGHSGREWCRGGGRGVGGEAEDGWQHKERLQPPQQPAFAPAIVTVCIVCMALIAPKKRVGKTKLGGGGGGGEVEGWRPYLACVALAIGSHSQSQATKKGSICWEHTAPEQNPLHNLRPIPVPVSPPPMHIGGPFLCENCHIQARSLPLFSSCCPPDSEEMRV